MTPSRLQLEAAGDGGLSLSPPRSQLFVADAGIGSPFVVDAGTPEEVDASVATEGADDDAAEARVKREVEIITGAGASPSVGKEERPSPFSSPREGWSSRRTESETLVDRSTAACSECSAGVDNGGQEQQLPTPEKEAVREAAAAAAAATAAEAVSTAKTGTTAKVNATKQLESDALKSPGLAAALQWTAEGRA